MGFLALATLPLYVAVVQWIADLLSTFARNDAGYTGFTHRALRPLPVLIMLPATFCAGMTLPLITRTLIADGSGERAIGAVYAWNTMGSILGVILGGLVLLPVIGLKGMLIAGARDRHGRSARAARSAGRWQAEGRRLAPMAAFATVGGGAPSWESVCGSIGTSSRAASTAPAVWSRRATARSPSIATAAPPP